MKKISFVVPVFNEASAIPLFLASMQEVWQALEAQNFAIELLFVNDGSTDATLDVLRDARRDNRRIAIIDLSRNFGKEAALTAGLDEADGDAVIPMDVDLQDPPEVVLHLVRKWTEGYETVVAHRCDRSNDGFLKRQSAYVFYKFHNLVADTPIQENVGDFRLLDKVVVSALRRLPERQRFMKGLFAWVGFRTASVEYERRPRMAGASKFSVWKLWNLALDGIMSFSTVPLRAWSYIGGLISLLAFLYMIFIVSRTILRGIEVPGYASLLVVVLFLGGIQLIGIGILGEYLGRVYREVKQRPTYIVRRRYRDEA
jgi:polyisoprenyl-phosphate glycosyltransferase